MRIAVLTTSYPRAPGDPSGHFVASEARRLAEHGHDVWVLAPGARAELDRGSPHLVWLPSGSAFGWPGVVQRLRDDPWRSIGVLRFAGALLSALAEHGPFDRIVAHWLLPTGALALAARHGAELELVAHGSDVRLLQRAPGVARLYLRALLARQARLRCVSRELADALVALEPRTAPAIRVEPCALDLPRVNRADARAELHQDERTLLLFVGRLLADKRPDTALRAALLLPDARCVVIGDGPLRCALERQFPTVEFLGTLSRERCLRWIAAANVLITASTLEGAPTVVREARALGTTVVSCPAGDLLGWSATDPGLHVLEKSQHPAQPWFR